MRDKKRFEPFVRLLIDALNQVLIADLTRKQKMVRGAQHAESFVTAIDSLFNRQRERLSFERQNNLKYMIILSLDQSLKQKTRLLQSEDTAGRKYGLENMLMRYLSHQLILSDVTHYAQESFESQRLLTVTRLSNPAIQFVFKPKDTLKATQKNILAEMKIYPFSELAFSI